jgi:hypothetical protein
VNEVDAKIGWWSEREREEREMKVEGFGEKRRLDGELKWNLMDFRKQN